MTAFSGLLTEDAIIGHTPEANGTYQVQTVIDVRTTLYSWSAFWLNRDCQWRWGCTRRCQGRAGEVPRHVRPEVVVRETADDDERYTAWCTR